ncbi:MAG TPA: TIR domain-containing protein [Acidobacteriaceae bacterium]|nr:TIR domain-containing protein [Acidobacteriaceae bacterium]
MNGNTPRPINPPEELREIAQRLQALEHSFDDTKYKKPLDAMRAATEEVSRAWGGSWLGFESRIYYQGFATPPPGAYFNAGFSRLNSAMNSAGTWTEYGRDVVEKEIYRRGGNPNLTAPRQLSKKLRESFETEKEAVVVILRGLTTTSSDAYYTTLLGEAENAKVFSQSEFIAALRPKQIIASAFSPASSQGVQTPPHIALVAELLAIEAPAVACGGLAKVARKTYSHIERTVKKQEANSRVGTNVFIGHGRSNCWKDLKDFIHERLHLPWDEFNRVPVAGTTNVARLSEMLDAAAIALIVMTAEDEQIDGKLRARMNVIHEAGLFQGRLGFTKAILLLGEGCEEFSNILGLGQIRFSTGKIADAFEEIRRVLEREELIDDRGRS